MSGEDVRGQGGLNSCSLSDRRPLVSATGAMSKKQQGVKFSG